VAQVVDRLPCKSESLSSNPNTTTTKKKKKKTQINAYKNCDKKSLQSTTLKVENMVLINLTI
jgi:hypothetical protein